MIYDLALAWITKEDAPFAELLDTACRSRNLSFLQITPVNLDDVLRTLDDGSLSFRAFLDRGSDEDEQFIPLVRWARRNRLLRINSHEKALRARDKALMHLKLWHQLHTPYTIILPPYEKEQDLGPLDLSPLGSTFTIKPALGGGGEGVIVLCTSREDIQSARRRMPEDKFLLQARVVPAYLGQNEAWFRVIFNTGKTYPFWWNTKTHVYTPVTVCERHHFNLERLEEIAVKIARICGLHLFSTEIAVTKDGEFQVVDYVNDPLDLTPQTKVRGGVPDTALGFIAEDLAAWVAHHNGKHRTAKRAPLVGAFPGGSGAKTTGKAAGRRKSSSTNHGRRRGRP
ncbi:MAG TPA: hypothetical protein VLS90_21050 [Thermodesulfobacteriota bacterium]|nr:hypothetical protein [Thermodesulfobacteriota bacterium]